MGHEKAMLAVAQSSPIVLILGTWKTTLKAVIQSSPIVCAVQGGHDLQAREGGEYMGISLGGLAQTGLS